MASSGYMAKRRYTRFSIRNFAKTIRETSGFAPQAEELVRFKDDRFTAYTKENGLSDNDFGACSRIEKEQSGLERAMAHKPIDRQFITSYTKKDGLGRR